MPHDTNEEKKHKSHSCCWEQKQIKMKFAYIQKCKCGAKAEAPTIWLLKKDKKENLISGRNCTVFKK